MSIGENLKRIRKEKGLTQKKLGELCGMSESMIRQYELGYRNPKSENLKRLAFALECMVSDIDESFFDNNSTRMPYFANGLQKLRLERNLTQKELAKELNVTKKNISNWEDRKREPYLDIVKKIADFFDTSLLYLYYGEKKYRNPIDINDTEAIAREKAIREAPVFISTEKGEIDRPIPCEPVKFTCPSTSFKESQAREEAHYLLDSIPNGEPLSWEREEIAMQLRDILKSYNELNNTGRKMAVERIKELCYSAVTTDSRLDDVYFNRIQKKINNGEKLERNEIEWWHNYLDKSVKTIGTIFESLFSMLNKEGRRKAHSQINRAIEQIELLTKIPEYKIKPTSPDDTPQEDPPTE